MNASLLIEQTLRRAQAGWDDDAKRSAEQFALAMYCRNPNFEHRGVVAKAGVNSFCQSFVV